MYQVRTFKSFSNVRYLHFNPHFARFDPKTGLHLYGISISYYGENFLFFALNYYPSWHCTTFAL